MSLGDRHHKAAKISLALNRASMSNPGEWMSSSRRRKPSLPIGIAKELLRWMWSFASSNPKAISRLKASRVATGQSFLWDETKETSTSSAGARSTRLREFSSTTTHRSYRSRHNANGPIRRVRQFLFNTFNHHG